MRSGAARHFVPSYHHCVPRNNISVSLMGAAHDGVLLKSAKIKRQIKVGTC
jgi:hypothetical protein